MGITEYQRTTRVNAFGSSDMAALFGLDPFTTAVDVILEKIAPMEPRKDNAILSSGQRLEPVILDFSSDSLGKKIIRNQRRTKPAVHLAANIDAITLPRVGEPIEAKSVSRYNPLRGNWGTPGTDEVPDNLIIQCHVHMICHGNAERCHVAVLLDGDKFEMYYVPYNKTIAEAVQEKACEYWDKYVIPKKLPEGDTPDYEVVKRIIRDTGKRGTVTVSLYKQAYDAKVAKARATRVYDEIRAKIMILDREAEIFEIDGEDVITCKRSERTSVSVKDVMRVADELPEEHGEKVRSIIKRLSSPRFHVKDIKEEKD